MSGGFRLLTSDAPAADAVLVSSGPLLAASAGDWLGGGDVASLRSLAVTLYACVPVIADGPQAGGDRQVSQLTDPAGSLAGVIRRAASIIDDLAAGLTRIENDLEDQAHTASRYGVRIGTDRRPPPVVAVPSAESGAVSEQHWTLTYQRAYAQAAADAQRARQQAAGRLTDLHATLAPARPSLVRPAPTAAATGLTIGQFVTGLSGALAGPAHSSAGR